MPDKNISYNFAQEFVGAGYFGEERKSSDVSVDIADVDLSEVFDEIKKTGHAERVLDERGKIVVPKGVVGPKGPKGASSPKKDVTLSSDDVLRAVSRALKPLAEEALDLKPNTTTIISALGYSANGKPIYVRGYKDVNHNVSFSLVVEDETYVRLSLISVHCPKITTASSEMIDFAMAAYPMAMLIKYIYKEGFDE